MGKRGPGAKPARVGRISGPLAAPALARGATRADRLIAWIEGLRITSGAHAGRPLLLREWQRDILRGLYATDAAGKRPVRTGVVSMPRKQGKTALAGALALAHLVGPEAVPRGQVVSAAADRGQASLIFNEVKAFLLDNPELADRVVIRDFNRTIEDQATGTVLQALSADARKAHGLSPTLAIADEVAQWRGRELYDALATGTGAHDEALLLAISTRSPDPDNPLEELLSYGDQVAAGVIPDASFRSFVWSAPMDADPWAEATWFGCNPALGDFRSLDDVRAQAMKAMRVPSLESSFRAYTLNQPVRADDRFLHGDDWRACEGEGEAQGPCYAALDLSSGPADLTAFALFWPKTGRLTVRAFIPSADLERKAGEDRAPYRAWISAGLVVPIPGRAIDRAWLLSWIAREVEGLDLAAVGHDRWGINDLRATMEREGISLPLREHGQGYRDMAPSINAFEAAVLTGIIRHGGNALLTWALGNAVLDTDPAGNRKLTKARAMGRVDPLVAAVMAVGLASREPPAPTYEGLGWLAV